jgi:hypothetical protein
LPVFVFAQQTIRHENAEIIAQTEYKCGNDHIHKVEFDIQDYCYPQDPDPTDHHWQKRQMSAQSRP